MLTATSIPARPETVALYGAVLPTLVTVRVTVCEPAMRRWQSKVRSSRWHRTNSLNRQRIAGRG
jgi:hypothetical protein